MQFLSFSFYQDLRGGLDFSSFLIIFWYKSSYFSFPCYRRRARQTKCHAGQLSTWAISFHALHTRSNPQQIVESWEFPSPGLSWGWNKVAEKTLMWSSGLLRSHPDSTEVSPEQTYSHICIFGQKNTPSERSWVKLEFTANTRSMCKPSL